MAAVTAAKPGSHLVSEQGKGYCVDLGEWVWSHAPPTLVQCKDVLEGVAVTESCDQQAGERGAGPVMVHLPNCREEQFISNSERDKRERERELTLHTPSSLFHKPLPFPRSFSSSSSIAHVTEKIQHIKQSLSLSQVQQFHKEGEYGTVVEQLLPVLEQQSGTYMEVSG